MQRSGWQGNAMGITDALDIGHPCQGLILRARFRGIDSERNSSLPERCHYGNAGNGILEGPGFQNVDASLFKNFRITERVKLQFRSEFFNILNTPLFNVPNRGLNTGGGFLPQRAANGTITFPSQAGITSGPGAITSLIAPMRNIQFGLKLLW